MTLALIPLDAFDDLDDADAMHRETMALFASADLPGDTGSKRSGANVLWRIERSGVLVSADIDATDLPDGSQILPARPEPESGDRVMFALTADATVRRDGVARPASDIDFWLGTRVGDALEGIDVQWTNSRSVRRRGAALEQVTIVGTATVADVAALTHLLRVGVGRSKTFGCGLLTVRRA